MTDQDHRQIASDQSTIDQQALILQNKIKQNRVSRCVSVKDFGYEISNPLHYGIFDNYEDEDDEEDDDYEDEYSEEGDESDLLDEYQYNHNDDDDDDDNNDNLNDFNNDVNKKLNDVVVGSSNDTEYKSPLLRLEDHSNTIHEEEEDDDDDEINNDDKNFKPLIHAIALYPFHPENENELELVVNQSIMINYEYGDGWLVALDPVTGETGLVPSEYVQLILSDDEDDEDDEHEHEHELHEVVDGEDGFEDDDVSNAKPFLPAIFQDTSTTHAKDGEWEDVNDDDHEHETVSENFKKLII